MALYIVMGIAWILASFLVGRYIIGSILGQTLSYRIGLKAILVSYFVGVVMLLVIISNM